MNKIIFNLLVIIMIFKFVNPFNLYVLRLAHNRYYVGKTTNTVKIRYEQHKKGFGSQWTKLYKPVEIIEQFESTNKFIEDMYTKKYMDLFGIDYVRGGSYSSVELEDWQIKSLTHELRTSNDLCFKCGKHGHYASTCKKQ